MLHYEWIVEKKYKYQLTLNDTLIGFRHTCIWKAVLVTWSKALIRWLYSYDTSSYIRSVYSQCHVDSLKCTEQNVNNQTLTQVSQLYVHISFCLKVIRSWLNLPAGGHAHVICMGDGRRWIELNKALLRITIYTSSILLKACSHTKNTKKQQQKHGKFTYIHGNISK